MAKSAAGTIRRIEMALKKAGDRGMHMKELVKESGLHKSTIKYHIHGQHKSASFYGRDVPVIEVFKVGKFTTYRLGGRKKNVGKNLLR